MRRSSGPAASASTTLPIAWAASNHRPRPTTATSDASVCGAKPYQSQTSIIALKAKPSAAATAASDHRLRITGASSAPTAPHAPQPSICCGVQIPWPRKRFDTNAASAPVATPARMPSEAPATIAITVTGCTPGTAAKRTRPAAAAAPTVATTASSLVESTPDSNQATPAATRPAAPRSVASAPSSTSSEATIRPAARRRRLRTHGLPQRELDETVGDVRRPRQIVRDDQGSPPGGLRPQQCREVRLALGVDAARRLVEHEQLGVG